MKKHLLTVILTLFTTVLFGQPDCIITFRYKGVIADSSNKFRQIGLPTTPFIVGYEKKTNSEAFAIKNISDSSFDIELASHLSSDFCRTPEDIVTFVFRQLKEYPVKLFYSRKDSKLKDKPIEVIIPLDSIKFTYEVVNDRKEIVIDLGRIKT
jgi:hypothetical protein